MDAEIIRILIVAKIIIIITVSCIDLIVEYTAETQAYAPLLNKNPGGPALRAAGYPQKRGPLPPPTSGRGRLPLWRARPLAGAGP